MYIVMFIYTYVSNHNQIERTKQITWVISKLSSQSIHTTIRNLKLRIY